MTSIIKESANARDVAKLFNVSRESFEKLQVYEGLLIKWQKKINLVGPQEIQRLWSRHIADGLQVSELLPDGCCSVVDLGSGAGIPGVIVSIVKNHQNVDMHLVESNGKKSAFLREVVRVLDLPVKVHCERIESLYNEKWVNEIDMVMSRALAPLPKLMEFAVPFVENGGKMLLHKGLDVDSELTQTTKYWNIEYQKYPSRTHAGGCILYVKDFQRVTTSNQSNNCD